jgi:hypothetical protein
MLAGSKNVVSMCWNATVAKGDPTLQVNTESKHQTKTNFVRNLGIQKANKVN